MFWRWFVVFLAFSVGLTALFYNNFLHLKYAVGREIFIFGIKFSFSSYWTFLAFFILISSPIILGANYIFYAAYHYGYQVWEKFFGKIWIVSVSNSAATFFALLILTRICFHEWPAKGTLAGFILSIFAVLISIFWK